MRPQLHRADESRRFGLALSHLRGKFLQHLTLLTSSCLPLKAPGTLGELSSKTPLLPSPPGVEAQEGKGAPKASDGYRAPTPRELTAQLSATWQSSKAPTGGAHARSSNLTAHHTLHGILGLSFAKFKTNHGFTAEAAKLKHTEDIRHHSISTACFTAMCAYFLRFCSGSASTAHDSFIYLVCECMQMGMCLYSHPRGSPVADDDDNYDDDDDGGNSNAC